MPTFDVSVNKIFNVNIKYLFEKDRLFLEQNNPKTKLQTARINIINYINSNGIMIQLLIKT